ncbi:MAG: amidohydrolase family protein [bacterium]|nr:amidohydrolase family protein [bacterium]
MKRVLGALREAGVPILAGSDSGNPLVVPGAALQEELRQLTDAGIPVEEVWVIATRRAGERLGVPGLGTLEEGAPADLLLFLDDPTRDLAALGSLEAVIAAGRFSTRAGFSRWRWSARERTSSAPGLRGTRGTAGSRRDGAHRALGPRRRRPGPFRTGASHPRSAARPRPVAACAGCAATRSAAAGTPAPRPGRRSHRHRHRFRSRPACSRAPRHRPCPRAASR